MILFCRGLRPQRVSNSVCTDLLSHCFVRCKQRLKSTELGILRWKVLATDLLIDIVGGLEQNFYIDVDITDLVL